MRMWICKFVDCAPRGEYLSSSCPKIDASTNFKFDTPAPHEVGWGEGKHQHSKKIRREEK